MTTSHLHFSLLSANKQITALISTNLCSRGLDVKDVEQVVNYDCPKTSDDYVITTY